MLNLRQTLWAGLAVATLASAALPVAVSAAPKAVRGVITSIDGDNVTLKQPWGKDIVVIFDRKHREKPFRDPIAVGEEIAVILDPDASTPTAMRLCTRIVPAPAYVAVQPIKVPVTSAPPAPRPVARPVPAPAPVAPPPQILYW